MSSTIKLIGKTTDFYGRSLWQIVSNLKNFGVGRVVIRNRMNRYPEPSYMRIMKVEALPEPVYKKDRKYEPPIPHIDEDRKCRVWVEKVFRGKLYDKQFVIESASYKSDYKLLSKEEEASYCKTIPIKVKLIDPFMDLPPLLRELVSKETKEKNPQMKVKLNDSRFTHSRIAEEGETPDVRLQMGLGEPAEGSRHLYDGCKI